MMYRSGWVCGIAFPLMSACAPPPRAAAAPRDRLSERGAHAAIYGEGYAPDPALDPSIFEVKSNETEAHRIAEARCGSHYQLVTSRGVSRTDAGECSEPIASRFLSGLQTTQTNTATKMCSPATSSQETVFRFRCVGR